MEKGMENCHLGLKKVVSNILNRPNKKEMQCFYCRYVKRVPLLWKIYERVAFSWTSGLSLPV